jgi:hypothetical protein
MLIVRRCRPKGSTRPSFRVFSPPNSPMLAIWLRLAMMGWIFSLVVNGFTPPTGMRTMTFSFASLLTPNIGREMQTIRPESTFFSTRDGENSAWSSSSPASPSFVETNSGLYVPQTYESDGGQARITALLATRSKSGIGYEQVMEGIDHLFPPDGLDKRTALSRKDGYWPFISKGTEPPKEFVYGEFDVLFFAQVLDRAKELWSAGGNDNANDNDDKDWRNKVFCDLGSGTGRLVLAAAALHPWKLCRGIELLQGIHEAAQLNLEQCRMQSDEDSVDIGSTQNNDSVEVSSSTTSTMGEAASNDGSGGAATAATAYNAWQQVYLQQYRNSIPNNDDWLNQLSESFEEEEEEEENVDANDEDGGWETLEEDDQLDEKENVEANIPSFRSSGQPIPDTAVSTSTKVAVNYHHSTNEYALPHGTDQQENEPRLVLAPIELSCGSMDDPYEYFGDADCVFVFSTAMPNDVIAMISRAVGRQCKPGSIVITSEYSLPLEGTIEPLHNDPAMASGTYRLELVEELTGDCWCTGGVSTVFFHRVVESLWDGNYKRIKPLVAQREDGTNNGSLEDKTDEARRIGQALNSWGMPQDFSMP